MKRICMVVFAMMLLSLPALADDHLSLPDGREVRLAVSSLGEQYRGTEGNAEMLWLLQMYEGNSRVPFQSLAFATQREEAAVMVRDLNFDGWPDLDILYLLGASNSQHIFFFYDQESGQYEPWHYGYAWLSNYETDEEKQWIVNYIHDSAATGTKEVYRWEGKKLQLLRRWEIKWNDENPEEMLFFVWEADLENGGLKELYSGGLSPFAAPEGAERELHRELDEILFQGL